MAEGGSASKLLPTQQRILEAALDLFIVHGYGSTSLRQIADRLGFTKAALYYHYQAKDDILLELVRPLFDALDEALGLPAGAAVPDRRRRRAVLGAYLDTCLRHRRLVRFVARDVSALSQPEVHQRAEDLDRRLREMLAGPAADTEQIVRASSAVGTIWRPLVHLSDVDLEQHRDLLVGAALAVLSGRVGSTPA